MDGVVHQFLVAHKAAENIGDEKNPGFLGQFLISLVITAVPEPQPDAADHHEGVPGADGLDNFPEVPEGNRFRHPVFKVIAAESDEDDTR